jgi:hypothetical protein
MKENQNAGLHASIPRLLLSFFLISFATVIHAQQISGTVSDDAGKNLPGVSVLVKGTSRATITDDAGKFIINAPANAVLVITSVGFVRQEVPVNGNRSVNISMTRDFRNMEDIVVTS